MGYDFSGVALPDIVAAMQRDPRVLLAKQNLADGGNTSPAYGMGGLGRILQGIVGGLSARSANNKYGAQQTQYMDDVRNSIASILGGQAPDKLHQSADAGLPAPPDAGSPPDITNAGESGILGRGPTATPLMAPTGLGGPPNPGPQPSVMPMNPNPGPPNPGMPPPNPGMMPGMGPGQPGSGSAMQPGMPAPPGAPPPLQSTRLKLGQALMGKASPYSFNTGLQDVDAGLEEDAQNKALAQSRDWDIAKLKYGAQVQDYYGARGDQRSAEYGRQSQERGFTHDDAELRARFNHDWLMQKDTQGFTASEADKDRLFNTYKLIADTTGEMPTNLSTMTPDAVWGSIKQQESGGEKNPGMAVGEQTKFGRALGSTQMLPTTAQAMAAKLGVEWQPELMHSNTPEALAYQDQLGRAYFNEGLEKYNGDYRKAAMYYYGGADENKWGPKTRQYASDVLGRLPSGVASNVPSGQPALFGINLSANPKKPVPSRIQGTLDTLADTATQLMNIRNTFDDNNFGYGSGFGGRASMLFEEKVSGTHQNRVEWWKSYDMMNNIIRHSLFGSALTVGEQKQYERAIVDPGTKPDIARKRLDTQWSILQAAMKRNVRAQAAAYNGRQVYEQIGGDDMADMIANNKPLSAGASARASQVVAGGGRIPKGLTINLPDAPQQQRMVTPAFRPSSQPSFVRPQQQQSNMPWWLQATVPGR